MYYYYQSDSIIIRLPLLVRVLQAVRTLLRSSRLFQSIPSPLSPPRGAGFSQVRSVRPVGFVRFARGGLLSVQDGLLRCFKERLRALKMALRALQDAFKSRQPRDPVWDPVLDPIWEPK